LFLIIVTDNALHFEIINRRHFRAYTQPLSNESRDFASDSNLTGAQRKNAGTDFKQRGFTGAIMANETKAVAGGERNINVLEALNIGPTLSFYNTTTDAASKAANRPRQILAAEKPAVEAGQRQQQIAISNLQMHFFLNHMDL